MDDQLQQFRQKKDGKGGKSSGKSSKPGHDNGGDAEKSTVMSEKVLDGEVLVSDSGDVNTSSELHRPKDSVVVDKDVGAVDQSSTDNIGKSTSGMTVEKLHLEDSGKSKRHSDDAKISVPSEGGGGISGGPVNVELGNLRTSDIVISEEESIPFNIPGPVDLSSQLDMDKEAQVTAVGCAFSLDTS